MATPESINASAVNLTSDYGEWASHTSYRLFQARYLAEAANAMLHECETTDKDEKLTGVSFLLTMIAKHCDELSTEVADTEEQYVAKAATQGARHG